MPIECGVFVRPLLQVWTNWPTVSEYDSKPTASHENTSEIQPNLLELFLVLPGASGWAAVIAEGRSHAATAAGAAAPEPDGGDKPWGWQKNQGMRGPNNIRAGPTTSKLIGPAPLHRPAHMRPKTGASRLSISPEFFVFKNFFHLNFAKIYGP
jgi:hypothetical protein